MSINKVLNLDNILNLYNKKNLYNSTLPPLYIIDEEIKNKNIYISNNKSGSLLLINRHEWFDCYLFIKDIDFKIELSYNLPIVFTCYGFSENIQEEIDIDLYRFLIKNFKFYAKWQYYEKKIILNTNKNKCSNFVFKIANLNDAMYIKNILDKNLKKLGRIIPTINQIKIHIYKNEIFLVKDKFTNEILGVKIIKYNGRTATDHGIAVIDKCRGKGVAKFLLNSFFEYIKNIGIIRTDAWINPDNIPSIKLHESCGYISKQRYLFKFINYGG